MADPDADAIEAGRAATVGRPPVLAPPKTAGQAAGSTPSQGPRWYQSRKVAPTRTPGRPDFSRAESGPADVLARLKSGLPHGKGLGVSGTGPSATASAAEIPAPAPGRRKIPGMLGKGSLVAAALAQPAAGLLARWDWRADLLTHFQEPALAATLLAVAALACRHRRLAAALGLLAIGQAWGLARVEGPNPVPAGPGAPGNVRVLMANVHAENRDPGRMLGLIRRERPDVVGIVEYTGRWADALAGELRREYPHRAEAPGGHAGLALWFREPPIGVEWAAPVPGGRPWLHATLRIGGRPAHLWLVHPTNPVNRRGRLPGNPELAELAARAAIEQGPRVMIGDFNCTDGSPHFADFLGRSGLRDSRPGFGRQASWPTWSPYRIAIDHAFLSPDLAVVGRRLGPDIGSDHRPVILDVAPAPASARKAAAQPAQSPAGSAPANLTRSASRSSATSGPAESAPTSPASPGSAATSSVVRDPQAGPNRSASAARTSSARAIRRRRSSAGSVGGSSGPTDAA